MYDLFLTELADADLDSIVQYLLGELASPMAASSFLDAVDRCYDLLRTNPYGYEACRAPHLRSEGYRKATLPHCLLIYKVDDEAKRVTIYRFFHSTQNYAKLL